MLGSEGRKALSEEKHKMEEDFDQAVKGQTGLDARKEVNGQLRLKGERQILDTRCPPDLERKMSWKRQCWSQVRRELCVSLT